MVRKSKTKITARLKKEMGLRKSKKGEIIDKYGRVLEEYIDDHGFLDLRPTGRVAV